MERQALRHRHRQRRQRALRALFWYGIAIGGVAALTWMISQAPSRLPARSLEGVYLLLVLALAGLGGSGPAIAASVLAFLAFDWFFVQPVGKLTIDDPGEWLSLGLFLTVGISTSSLAAGLKRRAEEARRRAQETATLYELSTALLGGASLEHILISAVERLADTLALDGAALLLLQPDGTLAVTAQTGVPRDIGERIARDAAARSALFDVRTDSGQIAIVRPLVHDLNDRAATPRLRAVYAPLATGGHPLGVLVALTPLNEPPLDSGSVRLVAAFAAQIALAISRARLAEEEERARAAAESERLKTTFLASISHDLRTPLTAIKAAAGELLANPAAGEATEAAASIDREVDRLDRLVGNLLELSRLEGGTLPPHKTPEDLGELIGVAMGRVSPLLERRRLNVHVSPALPLVPLDAAQIERLLINLLENAIKFSPEDAVITIEAQTHGHEALLSVHNPGPPIPPAEQTRIFEKFYRLPGAANGARGTGLGLAICKGIVEAHGGRIWTTNEAGGVSFYVTLPLGEETMATASLEAARA